MRREPREATSRRPNRSGAHRAATTRDAPRFVARDGASRAPCAHARATAIIADGSFFSSHRTDMAIKPCNKAALRALLSVFSAGLRASAHADLDELLLALRVMQPRNAAVDLCDVRLRIGRRDWIGALHILRTLEEQERGTPLCAALQSWCLYALHDDDWRRYAQTVLLSGDRASTVLVGRFLKVSELAMGGVGGHDDDDVAARIAQLLRLDRYQWTRHAHARGIA